MDRVNPAHGPREPPDRREGREGLQGLTGGAERSSASTDSGASHQEVSVGVGPAPARRELDAPPLKPPRSERRGPAQTDNPRSRFSAAPTRRPSGPPVPGPKPSSGSRRSPWAGRGHAVAPRESATIGQIERGNRGNIIPDTPRHLHLPSVGAGPAPGSPRPDRRGPEGAATPPGSASEESATPGHGGGECPGHPGLG